MANITRFGTRVPIVYSLDVTIALMYPGNYPSMANITRVGTGYAEHIPVMYPGIYIKAFLRRTVGSSQVHMGTSRSQR